MAAHRASAENLAGRILQAGLGSKKIRPRPVRPAQPAETDGPPSRLARADPVVPLVAIAVPAYYLIPYLAR
jgi:hypothetical protein